jgi:large subunit ribosomal protein L17
MRHNKSGRQLGRNGSHRRADFRNLVTSLFEHGKIQTTDAKAKEVRRIAEKLITLGKRGDLHARRQALAYVRKRDVVAKLFSELSEKFAQRPGGYTRILKLGVRRGDCAPVSVLELVQESYAPGTGGGAKATDSKAAGAGEAGLGT